MENGKLPKKKGLLSFRRTPAKLGSQSELDYHFKIPRNYIENNLIDPDKTYKVYLNNTSLYFIRSPSKLGSTSEFDYYFKIPRNYIENKLVDIKENYTVYSEEITS